MLIFQRLILDHFGCGCLIRNRLFYGLRQFRIAYFNLNDKRYSTQRNASNRLSLPARIVQSAPRQWQPYLRLMRADKPAGTWLLYWPGAWGIALAADAGHLPNFYLLALFGVGAFFMRSAGCTINDMFDKKFDRQGSFLDIVERTKLRPLASGELNNLQALYLLAGLLSVSLCILLKLNWFSVAVGAVSLIPVITYPLFKRFTYWPQAMLGITFNWGCILGWTAAKGSLDFSTIIPLYVTGINWTMVYDTIYAHQDKTDDLIIGVKSTAIKFGQNTRYWLAGFGTAMMMSLTLAGYNAGLTWPFYLGLILTGSQLTRQILTINFNDPEQCWKQFAIHKYIGLLVFLSITFGKYCIHV